MSEIPIFEQESVVLHQIIKSIPTTWTSCRKTSMKELVMAKGISTTVGNKLLSALRSHKVIETQGERINLEYRRSVIDSCIDQAVNAIIEHFRYHEGYKDRTFLVDEARMIKVNRKSKEKLPIPKKDLSLTKVDKKFFTVGDKIFLMHDNKPASGVIKAVDSELDPQGDVIRAIYEISLSPEYITTVINPKVFASRNSMLKYLQSLVLGDETTDNIE